MPRLIADANGELWHIVDDATYTDGKVWWKTTDLDNPPASYTWDEAIEQGWITKVEITPKED